MQGLGYRCVHFESRYEYLTRCAGFEDVRVTGGAALDGMFLTIYEGHPGYGEVVPRTITMTRE